MPRSVNKVASHRRRRKFLKLAKGYWGLRKNVWTVAKNHIEKGLQHAYVGRKRKKEISEDCGLCVLTLLQD